MLIRENVKCEWYQWKLPCTLGFSVKRDAVPIVASALSETQTYEIQNQFVEYTKVLNPKKLKYAKYKKMQKKAGWKKPIRSLR